MRKLIYAFGLTSALVFALAAHAAAPNFAGTWTLDKSKSQGLNPRWESAESVKWNVTQDEKQITVEEKVTGGGMGPGGPPPSGAPAGGAPQGGGPGGGGPGRGMMGGPRTYNLDGSETSGEMGPAKFLRVALLKAVAQVVAVPVVAWVVLEPTISMAVRPAARWGWGRSPVRRRCRATAKLWN